MTIPPKFALFECANMDYLIRDIENERFLNRKEEVELLNDLSAANEHLCNILSGTYNKERENFDLIHKIRELEKENFDLIHKIRELEKENFDLIHKIREN